MNFASTFLAHTIKLYTERGKGKLQSKDFFAGNMNIFLYKKEFLFLNDKLNRKKQKEKGS